MLPALWWELWTVVTWMRDVKDAVLCSIQSAVCWLVQVVLQQILSIFGEVAELLPDISDHVDGLANFVWYLRLANAFLPLDVAFIAMWAYGTFVVAVAVIKWVLKFIPTLG